MSIPDFPLIPLDEQIIFSTYSIDFSLYNEHELISWLEQVVLQEEKTLHQIEIIFMTDDELLDMNKTYLNHDYYTDIITFPHQYEPIFAELYISVERVEENATKEGHSFEHELHRVMVHGVLHLCGYDDHSDDDIKAMRKRENSALELLQENSKNNTTDCKSS